MHIPRRSPQICSDDGQTPYFSRPKCLLDLRWAVSAGKPILPVCSPNDETRIPGIIAHARAAGFPAFQALPFCPLDLSQSELASASVRTLLGQAEAGLQKQKRKAAAGCFD